MFFLPQTVIPTSHPQKYIFLSFPPPPPAFGERLYNKVNYVQVILGEFNKLHNLNSWWHREYQRGAFVSNYTGQFFRLVITDVLKPAARKRLRTDPLELVTFLYISATETLPESLRFREYAAMEISRSVPTNPQG